MFGKVVSHRNQPLENVKVYHEDQLWEPTATSDENGQFVVKEICAEDATFIFKLDHYMDSSVHAVSINSSAAKANAVLRKHGMLILVIRTFNCFKRKK